MELEFNLRDASKQIQITSDKLKIGDSEITFDIQFVNPNNAYIRIGNKIYDVYDVQIGEEVITFMHDGLLYDVPFKDEQAILLAKMGFKSGKKNSQGSVKSPMPGKIISLKKQVGINLISINVSN
jgi:hypothetical protein